MKDRNSPRTGSGLRIPVSVELRDPVREAQVARMWTKIEARRTGSRTPVRSVVIWAAIGAMLGISVMLVVERVRTGARHATAVDPARDPGPLLLASHAPIQTVDVAAGAPSRGVALSDGSRIQVEPVSHIETLASSATEVVFRLAFGRAVFDVVPGGPRRWVVEAGLARVEVVGTRFGVTRSPERVHVDVTRGVVLVRGATVPDGVVRVEAGGELDVIPPPGESTPVPPAGSDSSTGHSHVEPHAHPVTTWRTSASGGRYAEAYAALGEGGVGRETARSDSADELLALADVARLSGHPTEAVEPLERILREHAASAGAALAAVTLGRIQLGLNEPAEAARAFDRALSLRVPAGLEEDVYARLVEARARAGDRQGAAATAREYERRFPMGRRSADVLRWSHE